MMPGDVPARFVGRGQGGGISTKVLSFATQKLTSWWLYRNAALKNLSTFFSLKIPALSNLVTILNALPSLLIIFLHSSYASSSLLKTSADVLFPS